MSVQYVTWYPQHMQIILMMGSPIASLSSDSDEMAHSLNGTSSSLMGPSNMATLPMRAPEQGPMCGPNGLCTSFSCFETSCSVDISQSSSSFPSFAIFTFWKWPPSFAAETLSSEAGIELWAFIKFSVGAGRG